MVDFNFHFRERKPEGNFWTDKDQQFLEMIHKHLKIGIAENRLALIEVCLNLLIAFIALRMEALQCEHF